jgi:cytochrome c-type protein NapB
MTPETGQKFAYLLCFVVISLAVVGYFVGLQSPMNPGQPAGFAARDAFGLLNQESNLAQQAENDAGHSPHPNSGVIPATHYAEMAVATLAKSRDSQTRLTHLKMDVVDPLAEIKIIPEQKTFALAMRDQNRAFNGAPPTVPHPIDQMSAVACVACHQHGMKSESLRIPRMSHQFLANCTQCHVEKNPTLAAWSSRSRETSESRSRSRETSDETQQLPDSTGLFRKNSFVGLPAPTGGSRAYPGAPPTIPHSTWMRVDCMSCHGPAGLHGIRSTHPWRTNCQQCHAPSSELDQTRLESTPQFLPPPEIE